MRVLMYTAPPWACTAYGRNCANVARRLVKRGFEVYVYAYAHRWGVVEWEGVEVLPNLGYDEFGLASLRYWYERVKPDVILQHFDAWVLGDYAFVKAGVAQSTVTWTPVDHDPLPPPLKRSLEGVRLNLAMSRFAERVFKKAGVLNVRYCPHGVDLHVFKWRLREECRRELGFPEDAFIFGFVGTNKGPRKNIPGLLRAFKRFLELCDPTPRPGEVLLYLHTYPWRDSANPLGYHLPEIWEALGITRYVKVPAPSRYLEGFPDEWMAKLYNCFDVLVLPSLGEGFGLPLIESAACGVPAIGTNFSSIPELILGPPRRGEVVEVAEYVAMQLSSSWQALPSTEDLARKMLLLYEDEDLLRRYASASITLAEKYNWDLVVDRYLVPALEEACEKAGKHEKPGGADTRVAG